MVVLRSTALSALGAALFIGCGGGGGGGGTTEPPGPPAQVTKTAGDGQSWYFGNPLPDPYRVTVKDANNRNVPGVTVSWAVASGGGSVSPATSQTNASGVAAAMHNLGPSEPTQSVTATVQGLSSVTFSATAAAPPTTGNVTVGNNFFSPAEAAVGVGGTVTWTWAQGAVDHNVTFTGGPDQPPRPTSGNRATGTYDRTFAAAGKYDYTCTIHAGMNGTIHVVN